MMPCVSLRSVAFALMLRDGDAMLDLATLVNICLAHLTSLSARCIQAHFVLQFGCQDLRCIG